jgi:hypothetical protein
MGEGWVGVIVPQMLDHRGTHALRVRQHFVVPEPQNSVAFIPQEAAAFKVRWRGRIVLTAVVFNNQARFVTNKIGNVASERHLPAEPVSIDLARS